MKRIILIFTILLFRTAASQELGRIEADRPDQTENPSLVPPQYLQFEVGFSFEQVNETQSEILLPTLLTKYGVNDRFELRLISELTVIQEDNRTLTGIAPIAIGLKTKLTDENGFIPKASLLGHIVIPGLSSSQFRTKFYGTNFRFLFEHTITDELSVGYNLGADWDGDFAEPNFAYTLTTGYSFSPQWGAFVELYGFIPQYSEVDHRFDLGLTYYVNNNIRFDTSGGIGLNDNASDYFIGIGASVRFGIL